MKRKQQNKSKSKRSARLAPRNQRPRLTPRPRGSSSSNAPSPKYRQPLTLTGTEIFTTASCTHTDIVGTKLVGTLVSPTTIGARLSRFSGLYEKYRINSLRFHVATVGSVLEDCSFIQAFDTDPGDHDPSQSLTGIQEMYSWAHNTTFSHIQTSGKSMLVRISQPDSSYFTSYDPNGDYRLSFCGQYYVYLVNPPPSATINLNVTVTYSITFFEPQIGDAVYSGAPIGATVPDRLTTTTNHLFDELSAATINTISGIGGASYHPNTTLGAEIILESGTYLLEQFIKNGAGSTDVNVVEQPSVQPRRLDRCYHATTVGAIPYAAASGAESSGFMRTQYDVFPGQALSLRGTMTNSSGTAAGNMLYDVVLSKIGYFI